MLPHTRTIAGAHAAPALGFIFSRWLRFPHICVRARVALRDAVERYISRQATTRAAVCQRFYAASGRRDEAVKLQKLYFRLFENFIGMPPLPLPPPHLAAWAAASAPLQIKLSITAGLRRSVVQKQK